MSSVEAYEAAKARYAALGVDTDEAIRRLAGVPVALHCWQGDDVRGFDGDPSAPLTGGIQTTGDYPGRARTAQPPHPGAGARHRLAHPPRAGGDL